MIFFTATIGFLIGFILGQRVTPGLLVAAHRRCFRLFWKEKSRRGRPTISPELAALIRRMADENPLWGAPRIHAELLKLGFSISQRTVSRYLSQFRRFRKTVPGWPSFWRNHRPRLAAMDMFSVPTVTFRVLKVLVVIHYGRRWVGLPTITDHPTPAWVSLSLNDLFTETPVRPTMIILDNDGCFSGSVEDTLQALNIQPSRTEPHCPWQNGVCERLIDTLRRELLDHVIPFNERHLQNLLEGYLTYYNEERPHLSLQKDSPIATGYPTALPLRNCRFIASHRRFTPPVCLA